MTIFKYTPLILATLMAFNTQAKDLSQNFSSADPVIVANGNQETLNTNGFSYANSSNAPAIFANNHGSVVVNGNSEIKKPTQALGILDGSSVTFNGNVNATPYSTSLESTAGGFGYVGGDSTLLVKGDLTVISYQKAPGSGWNKFDIYLPTLQKLATNLVQKNFYMDRSPSSSLIVANSSVTVEGSFTLNENSQSASRRSLYIKNKGKMTVENLTMKGDTYGNNEHVLIALENGATLTVNKSVNIQTKLSSSHKGDTERYALPFKLSGESTLQFGTNHESSAININPQFAWNPNKNGAEGAKSPIDEEKAQGFNLSTKSKIIFNAKTVDVSVPVVSNQSSVVTNSPAANIKRIELNDRSKLESTGKLETKTLAVNTSTVNAPEAEITAKSLNAKSGELEIGTLTADAYNADNQTNATVKSATFNNDSNNAGTLNVADSLTVAKALDGAGTLNATGPNTNFAINGPVTQAVTAAKGATLALNVKEGASLTGNIDPVDGATINVVNNGTLSSQINANGTGLVNLNSTGTTNINKTSNINELAGNITVGANTTLHVNKLTGDIVVKGSESGAVLDLPMDGTQKVTFENADNQHGSLKNPNPTLKISDGVVAQGYVNKNPDEPVSLKELAANGPVILGLGKTGQQVIPALRTSLVSLNRLADLTAMADRFHAQRDRKIVVWTDIDANHERFDDNVTVSSTRRNLARLGAQAHFSRGYVGAWVEGQKNTDRLGLVKAEQKERGYGVFAYAGTEVNNLSTIVDIGYRHLTSETSSDRYSAKPSMRAYSASAQVAYKLPLTTSVTLEPQLQVQVSRTSGYHVTGTNENANGDKAVNIHVDPTISVVSRVGTRVTKQWTKANLFGEINYLHTFDGHQGIELSDYSVENYHVRNTLAGDRVALKVGGSYAFTPAFSVKASLENQWGKHTKDAFGAKLGVEYAF